MPSITTSIRLQPRLRRRLEQYAKVTRRGRNHLIVQALERFLDEAGQADLTAEAHRQSLLASKVSDPDWETIATTEPWPKS